MTKKIGYVYCITDRKTGKQYIGQRRRSPLSDDSYYGSGRLIKRQIDKHGRHNFLKKVVIVCNANQLDRYERLIIEQFNTLAPNGYNIAYGGRMESGRVDPFWIYDEKTEDDYDSEHMALLEFRGSRRLSSSHEKNILKRMKKGSYDDLA